MTNVFGDEHPCINLVYVNEAKDQTDSYGQKTVRESSVVHRTSQQAHGNYWKEAD